MDEGFTTTGPATPDDVLRRESAQEETVTANRGWWDREADDYLAEHGSFLGASDFIWCPEGIHESDVGLLGDVTRRQILEVGCGAGNTVFPLLEANKNPGLRLIAFDYAAQAVEVIKDAFFAYCAG